MLRYIDMDCSIAKVNYSKREARTYKQNIEQKMRRKRKAKMRN